MTRSRTCERPRRTSAEGDSAELSAVAFSSDLGWMAVAHQGEVLRGLVFGCSSSGHAADALRRVLGNDGPKLMVDTIDEPCGGDFVADLIDRLRSYAAGAETQFNDLAIDHRHLTPFGCKVAAACRRIPRGQTRTYGQLAAVCGSPGAARAVGQVMAGNRFPLVVPCHRVVGAAGSLGGFSAPDGLAMKRRLLAMESGTLPAGRKS